MGCATARAKLTVTAASMAFPPSRMTSTPAWLASGWELTTIPREATVAPGAVTSGRQERRPETTRSNNTQPGSRRVRAARWKEIMAW